MLEIRWHARGGQGAKTGAMLLARAAMKSGYEIQAFPEYGGWRFKQSDTVEIAKLAVDTCFWPLYEIIDGAYHLNYKPRKKKDIIEWLAAQGRFAHLFDPEQKEIIANIQEEVDAKWSKLLVLCQQ